MSRVAHEDPVRQMPPSYRWIRSFRAPPSNVAALTVSLSPSRAGRYGPASGRQGANVRFLGSAGPREPQGQGPAMISHAGLAAVVAGDQGPVSRLRPRDIADVQQDGDLVITVCD